ncbi:S-layer homology domain-containing protein [Cohnella sp. GCM10027633]|uniref:S-layer homology domain-containing protein n=1 Tax=unclassified Cohnella TaxID=2636738 RepID=UPI0036288E1B
MVSKGKMLSRKWLGVLLALAIALQGAAGLGAFASGAHAEEAAVAAPTRAQVSVALGKLQSLYGAATVPPSDWVAFGLARSGKPVADKYKKVAEKAASDGSLRLATDYARVSLAVNANGGDAASVGAGKVDLLGKLVGIEKMTGQGPNAPAYALIAIDAAGYEPGKNAAWTRDKLVKWLVDNRNADGGWSLSPGKSDVDVTGIVLTALAPYQEREDVRGIVDGALTWLSAAQRPTGGFGGPAESSESAVQVLVALTSLGIDPINDERFQKNGVSALARLLEFRSADGRFAHAIGGQADAMATFYALLGLAAVDRWQDGLPGLYAGLGQEATTGKYSVVVNGLNGQLASGTAGGRTALEALVGALKSTGTAYTIDRHPQYGAFLTGIGGIANGKLGGYDGWNFAVKRGGQWVTIMEGMATFKLQVGDALYVYYGDSATQLIHSVTFEPAKPRAGQPVTVKVEQETYDWDKGEVVVSPAAGATVTIGGQTAATDEKGAATFSSLPQGEQAVSVTGYASGKAPTYVAWQSKLAFASYTKRVTVRVEGDSGVIASGLSHGGLALEAVEALLKAKGVKYNVASMSFGKYIDSVAGVDAGKYGGYDGWYFAVNREGKWFAPSVGSDAFLLEDGDEVLVYYAGGATKLAESVVVTPANPKPGQDVTVKVSYRPVNPETYALDPAQPVAGATVKAGAVTAVTDANGNAVLKGLKEGFYTLEVTGYAKDAVPNVARIAQALAVAGSYADEKAIAAWALPSAAIARASGTLLGVGDSAKAAFKPQQAVTRAEFVAALARALGLSATSGKTAFADVPASAWYADEVAAAVKAGLVSGVSKTQFAPDATLTREQAAILLTRALKLKGEGVTALKDLGQVSAGAGDAVQAVLSTGWMTAYEGSFSPKAKLTREQAAVIAARLVVANRVK